MSLNREQYNSLLAQLAQNIALTEQKLTLLRLQEKVSQLFLQLNDSTTKMTYVPLSTFLNTIVSSTNFFKYEDAGERTFSVCKVGETMICSADECTIHFIGNELSELCKNAQWENNRCEIKIRCCRVTPVWTFPAEVQTAAESEFESESESESGTAGTVVAVN